MQLIAETEQGPVEGRERGEIALFAGIPYASPPVDGLRFAPPTPPVKRTTILDAKQFGPASPQLPGDGLTDSHEVHWDEDCLTSISARQAQTKRRDQSWSGSWRRIPSRNRFNTVVRRDTICKRKRHRYCHNKLQTGCAWICTYTRSSNIRNQRHS